MVVFGEDGPSDHVSGLLVDGVNDVSVPSCRVPFGEIGRKWRGALVAELRIIRVLRPALRAVVARLPVRHRDMHAAGRPDDPEIIHRQAVIERDRTKSEKVRGAAPRNSGADFGDYHDEVSVKGVMRKRIRIQYISGPNRQQITRNENLAGIEAKRIQ